MQRRPRRRSGHPEQSAPRWRGAAAGRLAVVALTVALGVSACGPGGSTSAGPSVAVGTSSASPSAGSTAGDPGSTSTSGGSATAPSAGSAAATSALTARIEQLAAYCGGECTSRVPAKLRPQLTAICEPFTAVLRTWVGGTVNFDGFNPLSNVRVTASGPALGCGYRAPKLDVGSFPGDLGLTISAPPAQAPQLDCSGDAVCVHPAVGRASTFRETDASLLVVTRSGWPVEVTGTNGRTRPTIAMATSLLTSVDQLVSQQG